MLSFDVTLFLPEEARKLSRAAGQERGTQVVGSLDAMLCCALGEVRLCSVKSNSKGVGGGRTTPLLTLPVWMS